MHIPPHCRDRSGRFLSRYLTLDAVIELTFAADVQPGEQFCLPLERWRVLEARPAPTGATMESNAHDARPEGTTA